MMRPRRPCFVVALALTLALIAASVNSLSAAASACNEPARAKLREARALLESGSWPQVSASFSAVIAADPGCRAERWDLAPPLLDRLTFAYLRSGEDDEAGAIVALGRAKGTAAGQGLPDAIALAAMAARYVLERDAWREAAALPESMDRFPEAAAVTAFARALGATMSGIPMQAAAEIAALRRIVEDHRARADDKSAQAVDIARSAAEAWAALEAGRTAEALNLMQSAVDAEDRQGPNNLTRLPLLPMRELLADMRFRAGDATGALRDYEASIRKGPPRLRAYWGAAQAAELAGDADKMRLYYGKFAALCRAGTCQRPGRLIAIKRSRTPP